MLSVAVPTKNRPQMLRRCIASFEAQTQPVEIKGCDFSPPAHDPGFLCGWYYTATQCTQEWMHFGLDDDWVDPAFAERCLGLTAPDVGMVITQALVHWEDGSRPDQINLPMLDSLSTGTYPAQLFVDLLLKMPMTISPSCAIYRREDVLDQLVVGKLPGMAKRTNANDCYMMLAILGKYPRVGWIADPLAHFSAHAGASTIEALSSPEKTQRFIDDYRQCKDAWVKMRGLL